MCAPSYPNAQFVTDLWQEGARLMQEGYLKIPPEVSLVWADTGYGDMQDGGKVAAGQGMYFHVAMMNGQANQLSEMVSVAIIQSEIGPLHQGRRDLVFAGEHQRHPAGGHDHARGDGDGVGRSACANHRCGDDAAYYRSGRRRSSARNPPMRWRKSIRNILPRPRCARLSVRRGLTSAGNAPSRRRQLQQHPAAATAISTITPRYAA